MRSAIPQVQALARPTDNFLKFSYQAMGPVPCQYRHLAISALTVLPCSRQKAPCFPVHALTMDVVDISL